MNLSAMKAQARSLAAQVEAGTATDDQVTELRSLVAEIETRQAQSDLAAAAVAAAEDKTAIDTTAEIKEDRSSFSSALTRSARSFISNGGRGKSQAIPVDVDARAITTSNIVVLPTIKDIPVPAPLTPLSGIVNIEKVSTTAVETVVESVTYGAATVAEGGAKPETTITYTPTTVSLDTVANYVKATRQALEDETRLAAIANTRLQWGLAKVIEKAIGDTIVATVTAHTDGHTLLAAIRGAISDLNVINYQPTTVVLNPADAAAIDLEVLSHTVSGPVLGATYWGLKAVVSPYVPVGQAYVGDFATAVTLFDRGVGSVYVTDSDGTDFTHNIVTVLAETRVKAIVTVPAAIRIAKVVA